MDNGAAEGNTFGFPSLHVLAEQVGATEIIVPDKMLNGYQTVALANKMQRHAQPDKFRYMAVAHGKDWKEIQFCVEKLAELDYISVLGVPRIMVGTDELYQTNPFAETNVHSRYHQKPTGRARIMFLQKLGSWVGDRFTEIHCLGSSSWVSEVKELAKTEVPIPGRRKNLYVRGMDTSLPVYLGLLGIGIEQEHHKPRPSRYFHQQVASTKEQDLVESNIDTFIRWASPEEAS